MTTIAQRTILLAGSVFVALAVITGGFAPAEAQADEPIELEIRTIYAVADGEADTDVQLSKMKGKLTRALPGYGSFKQLAQHKVKLNPRGSFAFTVPGGTDLKLTYQEETEKLIHLRLGVGDKFQSDLRVSRGNTFFQAGIPYGDGILVLAITIR